MLITTTKSFEPQFWWCRQNMQRDHATWLIIAIWGQFQDVYVLKNVQIDSYMCATCHAFIPFCSMHPEMLTIRALLNGDQLCGHVYVAWPNYSNHCCRQQIKVSWDYGYLPGRKLSQSNTVSAQSSCLNLILINLCVFHDIITDIVIASGNPSI